MNLTTSVSKTMLGILVGTVAIIAMPAQQAQAVASWSRLYKMGCTGCHSTMPRLNYFGEKLMLRGNELDRMRVSDLPKQHVEVETGARCTSCHNNGSKGRDVGAEPVAENLFLHAVSNLLSFRTKITLAAVEANKLTEGGQKNSLVTLGKGDWVQFWVAGPVAKNVTMRIEAELAEGKTVGLHNYAVAFSNVLGAPEGLLNLRVGGFTHGEWLSISDQKRAFSPHFDLFEISSSGGTGEDAYKVAGAEPAAELYGYRGLLTYNVGASNGKSTAAVNSDLNYWSSARLYLANSGPFAGSSISGSYVAGTDSKNSALETIQKDSFRRYLVSGGLRYGALDLAGTLVNGTDDNWDLKTGKVNDFGGWFVQALYTATDKFTPGMIFQRSWSDDAKIEKHHMLTGANYYMRQNQFISVYYDHDLHATDATHPVRLHAFLVQYRAMF